ncbi:hypothetical protein C4B63_4g3139c [Trypanosoma cruzi]|uniref:Uncharacterized protein n=1 Tax=Trypanosoma cruzi TaxID=5693 RepID=A0A2V2W3W8_TRYCR|nr:hypothetical protein C4B63_4g3139c [Trypanosoma cruzi]
MFGRRVFASAGVPRHMWAPLHIQSNQQANRVLPSLAPLASLENMRATLKPFLETSKLVQGGVLTDLLPNEDALLAHSSPLMPFLAVLCSQSHSFFSPFLEKTFFVFTPGHGEKKKWAVGANEGRTGALRKW